MFWLRLALRSLPGAFVGASCAWLAGAAYAQFDGPGFTDEPYNPQPIVRSLGDTRERPFDVRKLPRYAERQTHRGWEVTHANFTVVAKTSRDDAHLAAQHVERAWEETSRLADHLTDIHRQNNFGVGAVTIIIDDAPPDPRRTPDVTVAITADHTAIYLNTADEARPLEAQLGELRKATAAAFFHVTSLDGKLPGWAREGLAEFIAHPPETAAAGRAGAAPPAAALPGGDFDLFDHRRTASDRAGLPPAGAVRAEAANATTWVRYLLVGDDGRHAPALFAALRETLDAAGAETPGGLRVARRGVPPEGDEAPDAIEALVAQRLQGEFTFAAWQQDPQVDQPVFAPAAGENPAFVARQREMLLVLKLARRFGGAEAAGTIRPKVVEFGAQGAQAIPLPAATAGLDLAELQRRLTDPNGEPWASLDVDGRLLTYRDTARIEELLGLEEGKYSTRVDEGKPVLSYQLDETTAVSAWLEEDAQQPRRPVAKFKVERMR